MDEQALENYTAVFNKARTKPIIPFGHWACVKLSGAQFCSINVSPKNPAVPGQTSARESVAQNLNGRLSMRRTESTPTSVARTGTLTSVMPTLSITNWYFSSAGLSGRKQMLVV